MIHVSWRSRMLRYLMPPGTIRRSHVEPGLDLRIRPRQDLGLFLRGPRAYEPTYSDVLRRHAKPGGTAVDAGANIGYFTLLLSSWMGPAGRVLAFEPDPANHALLERNIAENGLSNVKCFTTALADREGAESFDPDLLSGYQGQLAVGGARTVQVSRLDTIRAALGAPIDLIKIDVEKAHARLLAGASRVLAEDRPVVVAELGGPTTSESVALLERHKYRVSDLDTGQAPTRSTWTVLAVPRERDAC